MKSDSTVSRTSPSLTPRCEGRTLSNLTPRLEGRTLSSLTPRCEGRTLSSLTPRCEGRTLSSLTLRCEGRTLSSLTPRCEGRTLSSLTPRCEGRTLSSLTLRWEGRTALSLTPQWEGRTALSQSTLCKVKAKIGHSGTIKWNPFISEQKHASQRWWVFKLLKLNHILTQYCPAHHGVRIACSNISSKSKLCIAGLRNSRSVTFFVSTVRESRQAR